MGGGGSLVCYQPPELILGFLVQYKFSNPPRSLISSPSPPGSLMSARDSIGHNGSGPTVAGIRAASSRPYRMPGLEGVEVGGGRGSYAKFEVGEFYEFEKSICTLEW